MEPIVFVVAGNAAIRRDLAARLKRLALASEICHSAEELSTRAAANPAGCVLLDVSQGASDLALLRRRGPGQVRLPVVAIATRPRVALAVRAMKLGAKDFLEASCPDRRLARALREACRAQAADHRRVARQERIRRRRALLNPGCREVLDRLLAGKLNREIAAELKLSVRAIEERRAKVMRTMRANSLAELVRLALTIDGPAQLAAE